MKFIPRLLLSIVLCATATSASAQYYEVANQITNMLRPILSGSFNYKGYVELDGIAGIGDQRANFIGISTSQGVKYADWFFMGVGLGLDVAKAPDYNNTKLNYGDSSWWNRNASQTKVMLPLFTDFRFMFGNLGNGSSIFIDAKFGATWLLGNSDLELKDAHMSHSAQFYLRPTVGVRIPMSEGSKKAFNIGITYQLITSNSFYTYNSNSATLNNIGATIGFEW